MKRSMHDSAHAPAVSVPPTAAQAGEVQRLFDRLARAVTSGDGWRVARLWGTPGFVVGGNKLKPVSSADEVATLFASAKDDYTKRGISDTRAEVKHVDWVDDRLITADVRWPHLDGHGHEIGGESSTYAMRRDETGELKIYVAVLRGEEH